MILTQLRHNNILYKMFNKRQKDQCFTRASSQTYPCSEENHIYYYANFDFFASAQSQQQFLQFSKFKAKLLQQLGWQWQNEANSLYHPHLSGKQIFLSLLQLWLKHHPPVNSLKPENHHNSTFNSKYIAQFVEMIKIQLHLKLIKTYTQPPITSLKAICLGFFVTANQIWEQLFQKNQATTKENSIKTNFLKEMTSKIQKTLKPIMVVTQRISSIFGRKKRKQNQSQMISQESNGQKNQSCYNSFRKVLDIEKQIQRKLSDFSLDDMENTTLNKTIEKTQFKESESPIQPSLITNFYQYVSQFLNRNPSWQIASNFVTQILDLNQMNLEQGLKIKVMRPAQQFYRKLIMVWLICKQNVIESLTFEKYLIRLKSTYFSQCWDDRYFNPTKYFYDKMRQNWQIIVLQSKTNQLSQQQMIKQFIDMIRKCMKLQWDIKMTIKNRQKNGKK